MIVQHNIPAINSHRNLGVNNNAAAKNLEKLSSGFRINRAGDDAAGLAISEKMRGQIRGLDKAEDNTSQGINLIQTAEGGMQELHSIVQRMRELSVQSTNGTYHNQVDRQALDQEFQQLKGEFDRICDYTNYNGIKLLNGALGGKTGVQATQSYNAGDAVDWSNINGIDYSGFARELQTSIVPQVMNQLMDTLYSFSWFAGSNIEIGLDFDRVGTLPSSWAGMVEGQGTIVNGNYSQAFTLKINLDYVDVWWANGEFQSDADRSACESLIAHEMMHAVMLVATTNGMDYRSNGTDAFPTWFIEGMAQTMGGARDQLNSYLLGYPTPSTADIKTLLGELTNTNLVNDPRDYGAGYIASMYLAYQVSGGGAVDGESLAAGLNTIMGELVSGRCLDDIISEHTKYTDTADFEAGLTNDQDAVNFALDLFAAIGTGYGSVLTGDLTSTDLVDNSKDTATFMKLNTSYKRVNNHYAAGYVFGGGDTVKSADPVHASYSTKRHALKADTLLLQVGANGTADQQVALQIADMHAERLGLDTDLSGCTNIDDGYELTRTYTDANGDEVTEHITTIDFNRSSSWESISVADLNISDKNAANIAIEVLYTALNDVSMARANLGAVQNRLEYTLNNLGVTKENLTAAESTIRDVDMAKEMMDFTKNSILIQSAQSMLAQANTLPQGVLQLLR